MFRCPKCQSDLPQDARFCNKCGLNFGPQAAGQGPVGQAPTVLPKGPNPPMPAGGRTPGQFNGPPQNRPPSGPPSQQFGLGRPGGPVQGQTMMPRPNIPPSNQPGPQRPGQQGPQPAGEQVVRASTPRPNMPQSPAGGQGGPQMRMPMAGRPGGPVMPPGAPQSGRPGGLVMPPGAPQPGMSGGPVMPPGVPTPGLNNLAHLSLSAESLAATSQAAEHWRNSWRDRQRSEAGPAVGVSRGQAVVPEPLMAMEHSLVRMRSIIAPQAKTAPPSESSNRIYYISLALMVCLILGLSTYIITTFVPNAPGLVRHAAAEQSMIAALQMQPKPPAKKGDQPEPGVPVGTAGSTIKVQGEHFTAGSTINFTFGTEALKETAKADGNGAFKADLVIPATTSAGNYSLMAQHKESGKQAFLNIQVIPKGAPKTVANTTSLSIAHNEGQAITSLTFKARSPRDADTQTVVIQNDGASKVNYSISTATSDGINWLRVNHMAMKGALEPSGTESIGIKAMSQGLKTSKKAYVGYIIFTVGQDQMVVPVNFTVEEPKIGVVITPNPLALGFNAGGTCLPGKFTIINASNEPVPFDANTDGNIILDGKTSVNVQLQPAGMPESSKVVNVTCNNVNPGPYVIRTFAGGVQKDMPVIVGQG